MLDVQENKALIMRFYEQVWGAGELDVADEVFAPDYVRHDLRPTQALPGPEGQKRIASDFRAAFPDRRFDVDLVVAEGDLVAVSGLPPARTARGGETSSRPAAASSFPA